MKWPDYKADRDHEFRDWIIRLDGIELHATEVVECLNDLTARLAAAEAALARIALSETGEQCASDFAQDCLKWKSTSELWDIIKAAEGGRDDRLCEATE